MSNDKIYDLAAQIDEFSYDYDTYDYQDWIGNDREGAIHTVANDILTGNIEHLLKNFQSIIEEDRDEEMIRRAMELYERAKTLKEETE